MKPRAKQHGNKPMSREYKRTMAFMAETFRRETPMTEAEREEAIRKAGGR